MRQFHHIGLPTDEKQPNEAYVADTKVWVTDFANPPELIPVSEAFFLRSDNLRSPMGLGITAFGNESIRQRAVEDSFGGDLMSWDEVVAYVESNWKDGGPHARPRTSRVGPTPHDPHPENGAHAAGANDEDATP